MTTLNAAREAIYQRFAAQWPAASGGIAYTFDNEDFDPPVNAPWVRIAVRHSSSIQDTLGEVGSRKFSRRAIIFVQIFTQRGRGRQTSDTLVTVAKGIFEGTSFSGINVFEGTPREIGNTSAGDQVNVEFPLTYYETI